MHRPTSPEELRHWICDHVDVELDERIKQGPFQYLVHTFFEGRLSNTGAPTDEPIVCANRGGGKTFLGAVATALDLLFKPAIQIRIIAGSVEQGQRMHRHLSNIFQHPDLASALAEPIGARRIALRNGSTAEVLAQSQASVRGVRVQKIRCDEVELFDREVWEALQLTTRSLELAGPWGPVIHGRIEALSTLHRPFGLMSELVNLATQPNTGYQLFRWGVVDVLEHCPDTRACSNCELVDECDGTARTNNGHIRIEDAIDLKKRVDARTWDAEMRCLEPTRSDCVYTEFDPNVHVTSAEPHRINQHLVGIDFGFRSPTAILFACTDPDGNLFILDERIEREVVFERHIDAIREPTYPRPAWIAIDPAGCQRNDHSGVSSAKMLRDAGFGVRYRRLSVWEGIASVRARIAPAVGQPTLFIHRRCEGLIDALRSYHFDPDRPRSLDPVKDGPDHACDALRYLVINLDKNTPAHVGRYA